MQMFRVFMLTETGEKIRRVLKAIDPQDAYLRARKAEEENGWKIRALDKVKVVK